MSESLEGITFCLTGTLSQTRDEYTRVIIQNGGTVKSTLTADVDYLVTGDKTGATKMAKARRYNIPCLLEAELVSMIGIAPTRRTTKSKKKKSTGGGNRFTALEID